MRGRGAEIKCALRNTGLTLTQLSELTSIRYGKASPYFVPPTFLYKLATGVFPHVCQIAALSMFTYHRLTDWMVAFGFDLAEIPRLQVRLHPERTVLVTPVDTDANGAAFPTTAPNQLGKPYLYVRIGTVSNPIFPELFPGSIVRIDTRNKGAAGFSADANSGPIYLVERVGGLTCCRVKRLDDRHILLLSRQRAQPRFPLRLEEEARILGMVDTELRPSQVGPPPDRTADPCLTTSLLRRNSSVAPKLGALLRTSRARSGLTFRSAHAISIRVAQALRDKHYAISIGLLSDYETTNAPPRHIAKIVTLCILYGIDFFQYLNCAGIDYNDSGKSPMRTPRHARRLHPPLAWPLQHQCQTDFPLSLVQAQNEGIHDFTGKRIAV